MTFPVPPLPRTYGDRPRLTAVRDTDDVALDARKATEAPRVPWEVFIRQHFRWRAGEHVGLIGPTGQGKTTLLRSILPLHPYVVVFATKPNDVSMDEIIRSGYIRMEQWHSADAAQFPRRVLWPDASRLDSDVHQKEVFADAFARIYREGAWTVVLDEGYYIVQNLGLGREVKTYLLQGRSLGLSLVIATQRPAWVPLEIYDQSTWLFFWRDNDEQNLRRLSGISWRSADLIRQLVADLEIFQVLCINTRSGEMFRTRAPNLATKGGNP